MSSTMKAVQIEGQGEIKIGDVPIPSPKDDEVLVKVAYAGQSPFDWACLHFIYEPQWKGHILGTDFSGTVVEVGSSVTKLKVGDRVAGSVGGNIGPNGSYAEYVVIPEALAIALPDRVGNKEAASLHVAVVTASALLFNPNGLRLTLPALGRETNYVNDGKTVLVNGGATSVGTMVIQLAKKTGMRVIATASPSNFELLKKLGADEVVSYGDSDAIETINKLTNNELALAVDTVAEQNEHKNTFKFTSDCLGSNGGKVATTQPLMDPTDIRTDAEFLFINIYDILPGPFELMGTTITFNKENRAVAERAVEIATELLRKGELVPHPVQAVENGFDGVQSAFAAGFQGQLSGVKLVFSVEDTPSFK